MGLQFAGTGNVVVAQHPKSASKAAVGDQLMRVVVGLAKHCGIHARVTGQAVGVRRRAVGVRRRAVRVCRRVVRVCRRVVRIRRRVVRVRRRVVGVRRRAVGVRRRAVRIRRRVVRVCLLPCVGLVCVIKGGRIPRSCVPGEMAVCLLLAGVVQFGRRSATQGKKHQTQRCKVHPCSFQDRVLGFLRHAGLLKLVLKKCNEISHSCLHGAASFVYATSD